MSTTRRDRPRRPIGRSFRPPHCPNRRCHFYTPRADWRWRKDGSFLRPSDRQRFQCFRCLHCRRSFSFRTFQADYWLRLRSALPEIVSWSVEGPGLRQIARQLHLSHATVMRHLARGARHALVLHRSLIAGRGPTEPIALDGFETFEYSQFFPFHLNLAAGRESWFVWGVTESPLRRKGRMTAAQQRRRAELEQRLGRPDPQAVPKGMTALLRLVFGGKEPSSASPAGKEEAPRAIQLHSDDHPAYPGAFRAYGRERGVEVVHQVTPGTEPRTTANPLFPVNLADLLLRHGQAAHRRETIAFAKRRQGAVERAALFLFWRNYIKSRREKRPGETAAMKAGIVSRRWSWADLFKTRRFPRRRLLPEPLGAAYWARIRTAVLGPCQRTHALRYAF